MDDDFLTEQSIRQLIIMLKQRKDELHLTYDEIVKKTGLSKSCIASTMSPQSIRTSRGVNISTLLKLCHALGLQIWLARDEDIEYYN